MAISIDWATKVISVPQGDLTLVSGTLYSMDTETQFRQAVNGLMDDEEGMVFVDPILHNTEVTVAGTTFARTIEIINGYSVTFTPDAQWSVRLEGSNNNIFDVENGILNQNQVQVIPTNSGGLIKVPEIGLKQATALSAFSFFMVDDTDHVTPLAGLTVTGQRRIDAGGWSALDNSVTDGGNGCYYVDLTVNDTNGVMVNYLFTATGADPVPFTFKTNP